jgi:ribose transport system substrate-binding protein
VSRKIFTVVAAVASAAVLTAAVTTSQAASNQHTKKSAKIVIGFPVPGPAPYIDGYFKKFDALAKAHGVTVIKTMGDWTQAKQTNQINTMLTQKPSVFLIWAVDNKGIVPVLSKIKSAGIPAVSTNAQPEAQAFQFLKGYTGPNDVLQGSLAADSLVKALGTKTGEIAMIRGTAGTAANTNRANGFKQRLAKIAPGLKLVADQNSAWGDQKKTYDIAKAMLQKDSKIIGIFSQDDTAGAGAAQAAKALKLKVKVVGVGGSCVGFKLIKSGSISATTVQDPWQDATAAFNAALAAAQGKTIPKITYLKPPIVTSANVAKYTCHW